VLHLRLLLVCHVHYALELINWAPRTTLCLVVVPALLVLACDAWAKRLGYRFLSHNNLIPVHIHIDLYTTQLCPTIPPLSYTTTRNTSASFLALTPERNSLLDIYFLFYIRYSTQPSMLATSFNSWTRC
jgi:hypothetical protein